MTLLLVVGFQFIIPAQISFARHCRLSRYFPELRPAISLYLTLDLTLAIALNRGIKFIRLSS